MGDKLEHYVTAIRTQDTHKRLKLAIELGSYLRSPSLNVHDVDLLVDGLVAWISSSNFKVGLIQI